MFVDKIEDVGTQNQKDILSVILPDSRAVGLNQGPLDIIQERFITGN